MQLSQDSDIYFDLFPIACPANSGKIRLAEVTTAYRNVLKVFTRKQEAQGWAAIQVGPGITLAVQGECIGEE